MLMKETRPFAFFGTFSATLMTASVVFMTPVLYAYFQTGLVERMPTWVFSLALMMMSLLFLTAGTILDSVARARAEQLRIHYMTLTGYSKPAQKRNVRNKSVPAPFDKSHAA